MPEYKDSVEHDQSIENQCVIKPAFKATTINILLADTQRMKSIKLRSHLTGSDISRCVSRSSLAARVIELHKKTQPNDIRPFSVGHGCQ